MNDDLPHPTIKHVVVLILENRGFDHLMGWLYGKDETPTFIRQGGDVRPFLGLSTLSDDELNALQNPTPQGGLLPLNRGARSPKTPAYNTGEKFEHIMNQMWGVGKPGALWKDPTTRAQLLAELGPTPPMTGYVLDYYDEVYEEAKVRLGRERLSEVLDTYVPEQVPVISGLARFFAVSDEWYCSVPSQTNTNRAFSTTGTSRGLVNNSFYDPPTVNPGVLAFKALNHGRSEADALPASTRSLFEALEQAGFSWKVFWQSGWPPKSATGVDWEYTRVMIPFLGDAQFDPNFVQFDASDLRNPFFEAARNGQLPAVSWVEPKWGGGAQWDSVKRLVGNDYHPVSDTTVGEDFVTNLYDALTQSPAWPNTLLVITFDENGGTFDHVPPPAATPSMNDACPLPAPTGNSPMDPETRTQYGFDFAQYGVRVPSVLVSPCVPPESIFRSPVATPFDHASLISTILTLAQVDKSKWLMGARVDQAPSFDFMLGQPAVRDWGAALSVPAIGSGGEGLSYNNDYLFEFVGDIWFVQPGPLYLAGAEKGALGYYPTFTADPDKAVRLRFVPIGGSDGWGDLLNMSVMNLVTAEPERRASPFMTVVSTSAYAFYGNKGDAVGAKWQVRLLSSRDGRVQIRARDLVYLVSLLQTPTQDPLQRLLPHPTDPRYLTTRAGEWALWRLHNAIGADNV